MRPNVTEDDALRELMGSGIAGGEPDGLEPKTTDVGSLTTRRLCDIQAKPISWLWRGRIARGKLTIIAGNPGLGKSQIMALMAAVVTTGGTWPLDHARCAPGDVLFLTAEDDAADTLRPRLEAVGADLWRTHIVDGVIEGYRSDGTRADRTFSLESDVRALDQKLAELGNVVLVVVDPISAYLGKIDSHRNSEVRGILAPLSELAARHNIAVVGLSHLTKSGPAQALMRVTGSLAFVAAARAAYLVAEDPQDKTRRLFMPLKNNLAPDSAGLAYRIEPTTIPGPAGSLETSRVMWEPSPVSITADEVMAQSSNTEERSALAEAREWLRETLADGPMTEKDVRSSARSAGISRATLTRAKAALRVASTKPSMDGGWIWSLTDTDPKMAIKSEDAHTKSLSTFGELEHLGKAEAEW